MHGHEILKFLTGEREAMLARLEAYVDHESPSRDKAALDSLARTVADLFEAIGGDVSVLGNPSGGDHVLASFGSKGPESPAPGLVLGHFDTVWPIGTLQSQPFRIDGNWAFGPGTYDMKASLVLVEWALKAIARVGASLPRPVEVLFTSDEEIGSPTSRALIEATAAPSAYALVLEAPLADGSLKTARKGVGAYTVEVEGKAAHAGVEPEKGISAINELAHQILRINELADPSRGTTINVGLIQGGTTPNVVPAHAQARVDVRVTSTDEAKRIDEGIRQLRPVHPGAALVVSGGMNRPPMERTEAIASLFASAKEIGRRLGLELGEGSTGGGSDGNFTAAAGIPTLDGLGVKGAGAHAIHEHILIDTLPERAALLACLLLEL
ncbi:M20 family metallopeptidase [Singulisphaera sp. PoT]|uniref:M20 family metallopeptidase n=1 Tax=Singulisphaera sp. PoT TaxID=3411797 RepID=UPI003BF4E07E